jgi:hypothetical protein
MRILPVLAVSAVSAAGATLAGAATLHAQQTSPAALEPGRRAIEFALPQGGGSAVGLWFVHSPATQVGVTTGFRYASQQGSGGDWTNQWDLTVRPGLKRHVAVSGPVVPHWRGGLAFGVAGGTARSRSHHVGASAGFGADWFPYDRVSIGGHMGVEAGYSRVNVVSLGTDTARGAWNLGTTRSALTLQLFF